MPADAAPGKGRPWPTPPVVNWGVAWTRILHCPPGWIEPELRARPAVGAFVSP